MTAPATALVVPTNDPAVLAYRQQAQEIAREAEALTVDSEETKARASELLAKVAALLTTAEARRKEIVAPTDRWVRGVNALFREVLAPVQTANEALRTKLRAYQREQERIAAERAAAAERERLAAEARLTEAAKAEAAGQTRVAEQLLERAVASETTARQAQAEAVLPSRTVHTASGTLGTRKVWTFRIIDLDLVPTEYVMLDEAKVRAAIRAGVREISGLEIYQDVDVAVRRGA